MSKNILVGLVPSENHPEELDADLDQRMQNLQSRVNLLCRSLSLKPDFQDASDAYYEMQRIYMDMQQLRSSRIRNSKGTGDVPWPRNGEDPSRPEIERFSGELQEVWIETLEAGRDSSIHEIESIIGGLHRFYDKVIRFNQVTKEPESLPDIHNRERQPHLVREWLMGMIEERPERDHFVVPYEVALHCPCDCIDTSSYLSKPGMPAFIPDKRLILRNPDGSKSRGIKKVHHRDPFIVRKRRLPAPNNDKAIWEHCSNKNILEGSSDKFVKA